MPVTSWHFPGTAFGDRDIGGSPSTLDVSWASVNNIKIKNLLNATATLLTTDDESFGLHASDFNFSSEIPNDAIITGVQARVGGYFISTGGDGDESEWTIIRLILSDDSE